MRWPLRSQILLLTMGVMLITLAAVSALNVVVSAQSARRQIERQLQDVVRTLQRSNFPLTDSVLRQMRGLSGAEYILIGDSRRTSAASDPELAEAELPTDAQRVAGDNIRLERTVQVAGHRYFHCALTLQRNASRRTPVLLHVLYPQRSYRESYRQAILPPILAGSAGLLLAAALGVWLAARLTKPVRRLQRQVAQIAEGDFRPMPISGRNDEIRDLSQAVNRMATMLADYADDLRRTEKLRALGQLRGGIAHQMRNAVAGCRVALDLYRRQRNGVEDDEALQVAVRQLTLVEKHVQRLLTLPADGRPPQQRVDLLALTESVISLVRPTAQHRGVALAWTGQPGLAVHGDAESLQQLLVNLLLNAIDAAASETQSHAAVVALELRSQEDQQVVITVKDSGSGPAKDIQEKLFEPLVTDKPDGIGLGLSVARAVTDRHEGFIRWHREDEMTCFRVTLPLLRAEHAGVETVGG